MEQVAEPSLESPLRFDPRWSQLSTILSCHLLAVQHIAHFLRQHVRCERLRQKRCIPGDTSLFKSRMIRVPGHVENLNSRANNLDFFRHFRTAHLRHDDIREQEMNRSLMFRSGHERLDTMARLKNGITMEPQCFLHETANRWFVFHQQDCLPSVCRFCYIKSPCCETLINEREVYFEGRALLLLTFDDDAAAALFDNPVNS